MEKGGGGRGRRGEEGEDKEMDGGKVEGGGNGRREEMSINSKCLQRGKFDISNILVDEVDSMCEALTVCEVLTDIAEEKRRERCPPSN